MCLVDQCLPLTSWSTRPQPMRIEDLEIVDQSGAGKLREAAGTDGGVQKPLITPRISIYIVTIDK